MAVNETVGINLVADTRSLRTQLKEATAELARLQDSATASAEEIRKAAKRAGELKDRIGDAKATVDAFNPDAKFKAFGQTIVGVAGAFTAVQGALALVGVESEDVQKTLLKVQGALALSEGLNSVLELKDAFNNLKIQVLESTVVMGANNAVTAIASTIMKVLGIEVVATSSTFKILKTAIAATGIGLLIVALGAAVVAFHDFQLGAERSAEAQKKFNEQVNESNEKQRKVESDFIKDRTRSRLADAKARGASAKEIFDIEDGARLNEINSQKRLIAEKRKLNISTSEAELELKKLERDRSISQQEYLAGIAEASRKKQEAAEEAARKKREEARKKALEEFNADAEKGYEELLARFDKVKKIEEDLYAERGNKFLTQQEKDIEKINESYDAQIEAVGFFGRKTEELEDERQLKLQEIKDRADEQNLINIGEAGETELALKAKIDANDLARTKALADAKVAYKKEKAMREIEIAQQLGGLLQQIAGKNKELAITGIIIEQAAGIAKIIQNTAAANAISVAASPLTAGQPWVAYNTIQAGLSIASSIAAGVSAISQINNAGSGSSVSAGAGASALSSGGSAPVAPATPRPQATSLDSASLNTISNVVARAYVVESDITGSQKRIKRIENAARI
jgi:hypothetical protein